MKKVIFVVLLVLWLVPASMCNIGDVSTRNLISPVENAWADEWVCEDSNYPINCNNGVCCATGYYCCHLTCCPSGSLCCPTGCCPAGYPWFCPENNRCYERYDDASINCGSILQQCQ